MSQTPNASSKEILALASGAAPTNRNGRTLPHTTTRAEIVSAFLGLLEQKTFPELTVADVLERAGVSRASFYTYFASMPDLLRQVGEDVVENLSRIVEHEREAAASQRDSNATPTESWIVREGRTVASFWRDNGLIYRAIIDGSHIDEEVRTMWAKRSQQMVDVVLDLIAQDSEATRWLDGRDPRPVVQATQVLSERLYYMAAGGEGPYDDQETLVSTLSDILSLTLLGRRA